MAGPTDDEVRPPMASDNSALAAPSASATLSQAHALIEGGSFDEAVGLLEPLVRDDRDPEALKLLGAALHALGDLPGAGAAWFATTARGPSVEESVAAWRSFHRDDFAAMWRSLPRSVRQSPHSPKVAALMAKAREIDESIGQQARARASDPEGDQRIAKPAARHTGSRHTGSRAVSTETDEGGGATGGGVDGRRRPASPGPTESGPTESTRGGADSMGVGAESMRSGADSTGSGAESKAAPEEGFDAARFIAWVLAALFVLCAVVGLITILKWIVPGG